MSESDKTFSANIDSQFNDASIAIDKVIKDAWKQVDERIAEIRELEEGKKRLLADWPKEYYPDE